MRLNKVHIRNFRSIEDVTLFLEPSCRVLVGINEAGKSNILKAIHLLSSEASPGATDLREPRPGEPVDQPAFVRFIFQLDEQDRAHLYDKLANRIVASDTGRSIIRIQQTELTLRSFCQTRSEAFYQVNIRTAKRTFSSWQIPRTATILPGWMKPSPSLDPSISVSPRKGHSVPVSAISILLAEDFPELPAGQLEEPNIDDFTQPFYGEIGSLLEAALPDCVLWSYSDSGLLPAQISASAFTSDPNTCLPLKHMFQLAGIEGIATEIQRARPKPNSWRNLLNRVANRSTRYFRTVWPEYRDISINLAPNGDIIEAAIHDKHNLYDFSRRSDGFRRFITFLLLVSALAKTRELSNTLLLYDEPDTSLHPSGARHLRDELIRISRDNYVVYATHSIFMIDRNHISRHLLVRKRNEATTIEDVSESNIVDEEVIYNALGYSVFENLRTNNIVFEGWRDKQLFLVALSKPPTSHRSLIAIMSTFGRCHARGAKDVPRITPMLDLARRNYVVLSDSDRPAQEQQQEFRGDGKWVRYDELTTAVPAVTSEDFIKPDAFAAAIGHLVSEHPTLSPLSPDALAERRGKMVVFKEWLAAAGIFGDSAKASLEMLKDETFSALKPAHIEPLYYGVLQALAALFPP